MPIVYIMRHGQAESGAGVDDEDRRLTPEGHRALQASAEALKRTQVHLDCVVSSPLVRAVQTAEDMAQVLAPDVTPEVCPGLAPGCGPEPVVKWLQQHHSEMRSLLLVGHLPDLGALTGFLLMGGAPAGGFTFRPGGMARVDVQGTLRGGAGVLRWLLLPEQLQSMV